MRTDKLTSKFQLALSDAQSLASGLDNQLIEPAHLMVALLDQQGGSTRHLLTHAGVQVNQLRSQLGERLDNLPKVKGAAGEISLSNDLVKILNVTDKMAQQRGAAPKVITPDRNQDERKRHFASCRTVSRTRK